MKKINLQILKDKFYSLNPKIILSCIIILASLILLLGTHFHLPDFYSNREAAFNAAQIVNRDEACLELQKLENLSFKIYNPVFHILGLSVALLFLCLLFKVNAITNVFNIAIFRNKKFIYSWINLSYIPYAVLWICHYMIDLMKYEYNASSDTMSIPFFSSIFSMVFNGMIYYPTANLLCFIVLNTRISSRFYSLFLWIGSLYYWLVFVAVFSMKFTLYSIGLYIYLIISLVTIFALLSVMKEKREANLLTATIVE